MPRFRNSKEKPGWGRPRAWAGSSLYRMGTHLGAGAPAWKGTGPCTQGQGSLHLFVLARRSWSIFAASLKMAPDGMAYSLASLRLRRSLGASEKPEEEVFRCTALVPHLVPQWETFLRSRISLGVTRRDMSSAADQSPAAAGTTACCVPTVSQQPVRLKIPRNGTLFWWGLSGSLRGGSHGEPQECPPW